jgi:hypothetical protein
MIRPSERLDFCTIRIRTVWMIEPSVGRQSIAYQGYRLADMPSEVLQRVAIFNVTFVILTTFEGSRNQCPTH